MLSGELDGCLYVFRYSSVDPDDRHTSLLAWHAKRSVEIAGLDRSVGKGVCLPVGVFSGPGLVRTPDTVEPTSANISAVSCSRVVARCGRRHWMDQGLGDL